MTGKKRTFVLYPSLGVGHLIPMVELAKHLLRHGHGALIAVVDPPDTDAVSAAAVARLAVANPAIAFRLLPAPASPDVGAHPVKRDLDTLQLANPALRDLLRDSLAGAVDALLLDMFCGDALDVAAELGVPAYFFFASAAGDLAVFLNLPYLYPTLPSSFRDMGEALVRCPGMPPIQALDMPWTVRDRDSDATKVRMYQWKRIPEGRGVLGPASARRRRLRAWPAGAESLPTGESGERHECLAWLDAQPKRSVVFLCFGSKGAFSAAQLQEIARGLESSGHRFLWVVRSPPEEEGQSPEPDPDLGRLLPAGFLERNRDRGMVVKNWVPQAQVVRHEAVGAFVTHCGWNSALEAIMSGLPMICWPLYAEQGLNKVFMLEEMKIAVALGRYEEFVRAEEVEAKVRLVMEGEEGRILRERLAVAREKALGATMEGGSSEMAFAEFLRDLDKSSSVNGECN
ncbi:unnamed protein product [Miscanthus lutarioriparius]|uniref:Glycosyltransferase n=1 Tax=Miscanthus lutarioriparius TaxID=422564 RepID=A0A811RTF8_9POAL|nr:unnamed protein product [Miscanthus lutarioriparius]